MDKQDYIVHTGRSKLFLTDLNIDK